VFPGCSDARGGAEVLSDILLKARAVLEVLESSTCTHSREKKKQPAKHAALAAVGVLLAALVACAAYRAGYSDGVDDGWWGCAADYGVVA